MALDKVVEEILESARKEADGLVQAAEKERQSVLQQAEESIAGKKAAQKKQTEEAIRRLRQQEISSAELEAKRVVINARKEMLDKTFNEVVATLSNLKEADKARLYRAIIAEGRKALPNPRVYCPRGEARLVPAESVDKIVEADIPAGLILESADGQVRMDFTFKTILESIWEKELKSVSAILFG